MELSLIKHFLRVLGQSSVLLYFTLPGNQLHGIVYGEAFTFVCGEALTFISQTFLFFAYDAFSLVSYIDLIPV